MSATLTPAWRRAQRLLQAQATPLVILIGALGAITILMVRLRPEELSAALGAGLVVITVVGSVLLSSDRVAGDFRSGAVQLWLQKAGSPVRYYAARLGDSLLAGVILVSCMVLVTALGVLATGSLDPSPFLQVLPRMLLTMLLVSSISFGLSGWLNRGAGLGAFAVFATGLLLERDLEFYHGDIWGSVGTPLIQALLFPESSLIHVYAFASGEAAPVGFALLRVMAYATAWVGLGLWGVRRGVASQRMAAAQGE